MRRSPSTGVAMGIDKAKRDVASRPSVASLDAPASAVLGSAWHVLAEARGHRCLRLAPHFNDRGCSRATRSTRLLSGVASRHGQCRGTRAHVQRRRCTPQPVSRRSQSAGVASRVTVNQKGRHSMYDPMQPHIQMPWRVLSRPRECCTRAATRDAYNTVMLVAV